MFLLRPMAIDLTSSTMMMLMMLMMLRLNVLSLLSVYLIPPGVEDQRETFQQPLCYVRRRYSAPGLRRCLWVFQELWKSNRHRYDYRTALFRAGNLIQVPSLSQNTVEIADTVARLDVCRMILFTVSISPQQTIYGSPILMCNWYDVWRS